MNQQSQPAEGKPPADNAQPPDKPPPDMPPKQKPFQFSLKHLLLLMFLVAIPFAAFTWGRAEGFVFSLSIEALIISIWLIVIGARGNKGCLCTVGTVIFLLFMFVLYYTWKEYEHRRSITAVVHRAVCLNNLNKIGLALQMYHDDQGSFPPAYIADENGKPMHSWRVLLLPYLKMSDIYDKYDFQAPWNGPNNSKLRKMIPECYFCPSQPFTKGDYTTNYVVVIGPHTLWPGTESRKVSDVTDGTAYTIAVVEVADRGIHWMEPRDLHVLQMNPQINAPAGQGISSYHNHGVSTAFADSSVHFLNDSLDAKTLKALLSIDGGEKVGNY